MKKMDKFKLRCLECGREITIKYEYEADSPSRRELSELDKLNIAGNEDNEVIIECICGNEVLVFNNKMMR